MVMDTDLKNCGFPGDGDRLFTREEVQREVDAAVAGRRSVQRTNEAEMRKNGVNVDLLRKNLVKSGGSLNTARLAALAKHQREMHQPPTQDEIDEHILLKYGTSEELRANPKFAHLA
jgi:hypothetical protein